MAVWLFAGSLFALLSICFAGPLIAPLLAMLLDLWLRFSTALGAPLGFVYCLTPNLQTHFTFGWPVGLSLCHVELVIWLPLFLALCGLFFRGLLPRLLAGLLGAPLHDSCWPTGSCFALG